MLQGKLDETSAKKPKKTKKTKKEKEKEKECTDIVKDIYRAKLLQFLQLSIEVSSLLIHESKI